MTTQQINELYAKILSEHRIPSQHHAAFLDLVVSNELDPASEFARELNENPLYQQAMEDALDLKHANLRAFFTELSKDD